MEETTQQKANTDNLEEMAQQKANIDSWMLGLGQTKAESKMFDAIVKYAKEKNVVVQRALCQPLTTFRVNSPSFYDEDRKKMHEKFEQIGGEFVERASKQFVDSRLSDTIKILQLKLTIERGYNVKFNPDYPKDLKATPYAQLVLTIGCLDMGGFDDEQPEQNRETNN